MTTAQPDILIVDVQKVPAHIPSRLGKLDLNIRYTIGGRSTQTVTIPEEGAVQSTIEQAVQQDARRFAPLIGKHVSL